VVGSRRQKGPGDQGQGRSRGSLRHGRLGFGGNFVQGKSMY